MNTVILRVYVHVGEGENESNRFVKVLATGLVKNHVTTSKKLTQEIPYKIGLYLNTSTSQS